MALVCAAAVLAMPSSAQAHSTLVATDPVAWSTIKALPEAVTLTFATPLVDDPTMPTNTIIVTDPMGTQINSSVTTLDGVHLSSVLKPKMIMDGIYNVDFRAVAADGFVQSASFRFTLNRHGSTKVPQVVVPTSGTVRLVAKATGGQIPKGGGQPNGSALGTFDIDFATRTMCYSVKTTNLTGITGIHVHAAGMNMGSMKVMSISDEIYVPVDLASLNVASPVCATQDGQSIAKLAANPTHFVMMVHTAKYPEGAVSGTFAHAAAPTPPPPAPVAGSSADLAAAGSSPSSPPWWLLAVVIAVLAAAYLVTTRAVKSWNGRKEV